MKARYFSVLPLTPHSFLYSPLRAPSVLKEAPRIAAMTLQIKVKEK